MTAWPTLAADSAPVDVTLLLEDAVPGVRGGVAGWANQLIRGLPDKRFAIIFLGDEETVVHEIFRDRPENIVHLECHNLDDAQVGVSEPAPREGNRDAFAASDAWHQYFRAPEAGDASRELCEMARMLGPRGNLSHEDFLYSRQAWRQIVAYYQNYCTDPSFADYFRSVRHTHSPLFMLAGIARDMPRTRCLHAMSNGYAGFLGALCRHMHAVPFVVTEHGMHSRARQIALSGTDWNKTGNDVLTHGFRQDVGYIERLRARFFDGIGRLTYSASHAITTLYEGDRQRRIADGAAAERIRVIPNGIQIERFRPLREQTFDNTAPIIALVGPVTPLKQIKTFVRAMRIVASRLPNTQGWIVGSETEDPAYAQECRDLAEQLDLNGSVRFMGFEQPEDVLARVRVVALTSMSEVQPMIALEAMASGIPVVCTDVGCCYELVHGRARARSSRMTTELSLEHAAGRIVPIAEPAATAAALLELLEDRRAWESARAAGIERVEREYAEQLMLERYARLYDEATDGAPGAHVASGS